MVMFMRAPKARAEILVSPHLLDRCYAPDFKDHLGISEVNLGHFRCHKRQLRTVYVQKCGFRRFWARKCPIKASKPNLMTYKGHFRHRIFTSGLNLRIPVSQKSLPMPSELFKYIWSEFRPLPVSLMGWNSPNFDHKIYEPAYVSSGQEEPCSCINNWTEISSKVFFNLYGNELKSKSLKWILVHF